MMRLLFLCVLLMLPAASAVSKETEGSGGGDPNDDDEDSSLFTKPDFETPNDPQGVKETSDHLTLIIIIVAVVALTLSGAAIITVMLVRRHMRNRQQGIYFVPTEQDQKGPV